MIRSYLKIPFVTEPIPEIARLSCSFGPLAKVELSTLNLPNHSTCKYIGPPDLRMMRRRCTGPQSLHYEGFRMQSRNLVKPVSLLSGPSAEAMSTSDDGSKEDPKGKSSPIVPNSLEVQSLVKEICETTSIAEFELKLDGFRLYVARDINGKDMPPPTSPSSPIHTTTNVAEETLDSNGSASPPPTISKPEPPLTRIQRLLEAAADEGLVIINSPKVGYFRRARTVKGKRGPAACKEKQIVKEGQVICYVEQLGGEVPVESDVAGEVIKILREDGEPVGYGDPLIAILPSFPGIKKLQ
ncbi:hypothetical protein AMTR_s00081p00102570 [Amborella trichopoda]|uniref:Lipoyl-binding domain-containing protein n=1 Tax=Amborella trichopoda TaxID=13333 RepID=W1P3P8_AMBTC|nr:hypothetical protein AMTR_s00081p00102570 [Amborella trichopoda]